MGWQQWEWWEIWGHARYNCVQAGGRVQSAGGKADSGCSVGVTGATTNRGTTQPHPRPPKKGKVKKCWAFFFLWREELGGVIYCTLTACSGIYSNSGDFPCKAAVLTGKPGGGGQVWGALAKAENQPRTTRPAGLASRCGHRLRLTSERVSAVRHSQNWKLQPFCFFFSLSYLKLIYIPSTYKNRCKHLKWRSHMLPLNLTVLFSLLCIFSGCGSSTFKNHEGAALSQVVKLLRRTFTNFAVAFSGQTWWQVILVGLANWSSALWWLRLAHFQPLTPMLLRQVAVVIVNNHLLRSQQNIWPPPRTGSSHWTRPPGSQKSPVVVNVLFQYIRCRLFSNVLFQPFILTIWTTVLFFVFFNHADTQFCLSVLVTEMSYVILNGSRCQMYNNWKKEQ